MGASILDSSTNCNSSTNWKKNRSLISLWSAWCKSTPENPWKPILALDDANSSILFLDEAKQETLLSCAVCSFGTKTSQREMFFGRFNSHVYLSLPWRDEHLTSDCDSSTLYSGCSCSSVGFSIGCRACRSLQYCTKETIGPDTRLNWPLDSWSYFAIFYEN